jgi:hypothetical protein
VDGVSERERECVCVCVCVCVDVILLHLDIDMIDSAMFTLASGHYRISRGCGSNRRCALRGILGSEKGWVQMNAR